MSETARATATKPEPKVEKVPADNQTAEARAHPASLESQILYQQRTIGNRAVQRLIKSGVLQTPRTTPSSQRKVPASITDTSQVMDRQVSETGPSASSRSDFQIFQVPRATADSESTSGPEIQAQSIHPKQNATPNQVHRAWYNFSIPFTDYEFDPSIEGLKTAGNLAVDKAKQGASWVKDQVVAAAEWIVEKLKSVINSGIEWLTEKFNEVKEFAVSSFADIKGAVRGILGIITNPISLITNAINLMDAGILSSAWRALTTGANAA